MPVKKVTFAGALVWFGDYYRQTNVLVQDGRIVRFGEELIGEVISLNKDYVISPNFIDMHTHLRYPNSKNDVTVIKHETKNALRGGYRLLCSMANTTPVLDNVAQLNDYLAVLKQHSQIPVRPFAALTVNLSGKQLVDLAKLKELVVGFSDDGHGVDNYQLIAQAAPLLYEGRWLISMHAQNMAQTQSKIAVADSVARKLGLRGFTGWRWSWTNSWTLGGH